MRRAIQRPRLRRPLALLCCTATLVLAGCATAEPAAPPSPTTTAKAAYPELPQYPEVTVHRDVAYRTVDGVTLAVDVCLPGDSDSDSSDDDRSAARASILSIHGGSWRTGDKSSVYWLSVCQWLASEGYVAFSADYRLAPQHPFPAGLDDLRAAVRWIRSEKTVDRYRLDPERVGAFGGSAGGNLAAMLGTEGEGSLTSGSRVAAVAELSGPSDLTRDGAHLGDGLGPAFERVELDYLGCTSWKGCTQGQEASPVYQVDPSDSPFFIGHSTDERIPLEQSRVLASVLRARGVPVTLVTPEGTAHSIAMLNDELRDRIIDFYRENLGD